MMINDVKILMDQRSSTNHDSSSIYCPQTWSKLSQVPIETLIKHLIKLRQKKTMVDTDRRSCREEDTTNRLRSSASQQHSRFDVQCRMCYDWLCPREIITGGLWKMTQKHRKIFKTFIVPKFETIESIQKALRLPVYQRNYYSIPKFRLSIS